MRVQKVIEVCDTCEDIKREVKEYKVESNGKSATTVLCSVHARAFEVLLGNAKPAGRPATKKAASGGRKITSVEEIEAGKSGK